MAIFADFTLHILKVEIYIPIHNKLAKGNNYSYQELATAWARM